jgi:hypothetical protein
MTIRVEIRKNVQARINTLCASKRQIGSCLMHALRLLLHVHAMNLSTLGVHERAVVWLRSTVPLAHCVQFMTRSEHRRWHLEAYIVTILGAGGCLLWDLQKKIWHHESHCLGKPDVDVASNIQNEEEGAQATDGSDSNGGQYKKSGIVHCTKNPLQLSILSFPFH